MMGFRKRNSRGVTVLWTAKRDQGRAASHAMAMLSLGVTFAALLGAAGCTSLTQPYPQKNLYTLSAGQPVQVGGPRRLTLRVQPVRIATPYNSRTFVYKSGPNAYTIDYYNGFLTDPDRLLTGELISWLETSGPFAIVLGSSGADYDLSLETNVTALYGDYSVKTASKGRHRGEVRIGQGAGGCLQGGLPGGPPGEPTAAWRPVRATRRWPRPGVPPDA